MRVLTPLAALLLVTHTAAQQPTATLVSDPFVESYQPEVSVSGSVIVAVMTQAAALAISHDKLSVNVVTGDKSVRVCLRAASRDGIYTSRNVYRLPKNASGGVRLPYQSSHIDVVGRYAFDELGLAATAGDCDSGSSDYYLLSSTEFTDSTNTVVYINSFGATDVYYQIDSDIIACDFIAKGRRTTYDFICDLKSVSVTAGAAVAIIRERFGREQPQVNLRIIGNVQ